MTKLYTSYLYLIAGLIGLAGCNDPKTFIPTNTDSFVFYEQDYYQQASQLLQADYLIVPDVSYSMRSSEAELENALDLFVSDLANSHIDYRIGIVRGTTQSAGFYEGAIPSTFLGSVVKPGSNSSVRSKIANIWSSFFGANGPNWVFILEAAKKTLQNKGSSFLRSTAQLVLVFISDSDDLGNQELGRSNEHYANAFKAFKSNPDYLSARAFVTGIGGCSLKGPSGYGYKAGTRLSWVANAVDSLGDGTICLDDGEEMAVSLQDLAQDVTKKTKRFKLQAQPVPGSVSVSVGGSNTPQDHANYGWNYNESKNEIVFDQAIPSGSSLQITYDMVMKLSRQPRLESMVVLLNGNDVPQSNSNGWNYNSGTKELRLTGSYSASHSDKIVVNYEVQ